MATGNVRPSDGACGSIWPQQAFHWHVMGRVCPALPEVFRPEKFWPLLVLCSGASQRRPHGDICLPRARDGQWRPDARAFSGLFPRNLLWTLPSTHSPIAWPALQQGDERCPTFARHEGGLRSHGVLVEPYGGLDICQGPQHTPSSCSAAFAAATSEPGRSLSFRHSCFVSTQYGCFSRTVIGRYWKESSYTHRLAEGTATPQLLRVAARRCAYEACVCGLI